MSEFNLLPWREQRRKHSIRRWQAGLVVAAVFTASTVCLLDMLGTIGYLTSKPDSNRPSKPWRNGTRN